MVVAVVVLPLELLAARVTAQGGAGYSKLFQNAFWLTKYPVDSTTPTRHASAAAANYYATKN